MEFVVNGAVKIVKAGESVNLPQNTLHTFSNKSNSVCKWVNIHSPKGFRKFFEKLGVPEEEDGAQLKSVSDFRALEAIFFGEVRQHIQLSDHHYQ